MRLAGEVLSTLGMVVCAITFLLLSLGTPARDPNRLRWIRARAQIDAFMEALDHFAFDCGQYPSSSAGLAALRQKMNCDDWRGPYLRADVPVDPWGAPYTYNLSTRLERPVIMSLGADRTAGGEFFNSDIGSSSPLFVSVSPTEQSIRLKLWAWFVMSLFGFIACLWASLRLW